MRFLSILLTVCAFLSPSCKSRSSEESTSLKDDELPRAYVSWVNRLIVRINFSDAAEIDHWIENFTSKVRALQEDAEGVPEDLLAKRLVPMMEYLETVFTFDRRSPAYNRHYALEAEAKFKGTLNVNDIGFDPANLPLLNQRRLAQRLAPIVYAEFQSSFLGSRNHLFFIPGSEENPRIDEWVQRNGTLIQGLAVDKTNPALKTYYFSGSPIPQARPGTLLSTSSRINDSCSICHKSGLPLHIHSILWNRDGSATPQELNRLISNYDGSAVTHPAAPNLPADLPGLGAGMTDPRDNCTRCHDGKQNIKLTPPFGLALSLAVSRKSMPPNRTGEAVSGEALIQAYRQEFKKWMLGN